ncbi:histidine--tRNA ligase [SCandidatus Aminicenantes bacterium Aminicenantia_JdfR_composite]|jgi:histidyl-tRNA synthetase|nr:histidine--tRNA ligase [SCandidatus Aminicenantes bacterium Aminicenantia_JdfR_composite]MCP2597761.1 histidine--tRNA ligase [Candidatus Aminicenantes bacterium AC-335-L06]MCP2605741.1 histidine--tRNA ligase [Candidatus Aminicenantes bacterium AC-335-O07]
MISSIKGTKDILPPEVKKWQLIEKIARETFELYGYKEIRTPIFEATELFEKGTGETSEIVIKEMYTFIDKGGRSITLRPEGTPGVVRALIEHRLYLKSTPLRFYYIGPMFRYDKPQKGRYRQFHQIGLEVFGEEDPAIDAEVIEIVDFLLKRLGISQIEILINSIGCKKCRPPYLEILKVEAEKHKKELCPDCQRKVYTNPLRIFDCKKEKCINLADNFPKIIDYLCNECKEHFSKLKNYLNLYGIEYRVEPKLARGLDYYTKTVFEFISKKLGAQDAVLGGGRYDDLVKIFDGPSLPGIGFAIGAERLISLLPEEFEEKEDLLYIAYLGDEAKKETLSILRFLRKKNIKCIAEFKDKNLKNQLSRANKLNAKWVLIIGEDELREKKYKLKDMEKGIQKELNKEELVEELTKKL